MKHLAIPVEEYDPGPHSSEMVKKVRSLFYLLHVTQLIQRTGQ